MMRYILAFVRFVAVLLCFSVVLLRADEVLPAVVVKVNDQAISRDAFIKEMARLYGKGVLNNMVTQVVIDLELKAQGLPLVTEEQIDTYIQLIEKQLKTTQGPYASIHTLLENQHMKMFEFRDKVKRELGIRRLLGKSIAVTDAEMRSHYDTYLKLYTIPPCRQVIAVTVFHRFSPAPTMLRTDRSEEEAKAIAEEIQKSWLADRGYIKTLWDAKKHYIRGYDEAFAIPKSFQNNPNFADVFKLSIGAISAVIKDKNGYNIYQMVEDIPEKVRPFEEVKASIKDELIAEKVEEQLKAGALEKIKEKYQIKNFIELEEEKK